MIEISLYDDEACMTASDYDYAHRQANGPVITFVDARIT